MPRRIAKRGKGRTLAVALFAMALTLACLAILAGPGNPGFPRRLESVQELSQQEVLERIERLVEMGDASIDQLVPLLGDDRPAVSDGALAAISGRLDRWQLLGDQEAFRRIAKLAAGLADQAVTWDDAGRERAARLASRLLPWPVDADPARSRQFVEHCQGVLQLARSKPADSAGVSSVRLEVDSLPPGLTTPASLPRRPVPAEP